MPQMRTYKKGETLIAENDFGETAYVIERGRVEVTKLINGKKTLLTQLSTGAPIGEMSMIDDKPRSATIVALEDTTVSEIHRDTFFEGLKTHPEVSINILKVIFERLRDANTKIAQLQQGHITVADLSRYEGALKTTTAVHSIYMDGLTAEAIGSLPQNPLVIDHFPFMVGRANNDPLCNNDFMIDDKMPFQISRHHLQFVCQNNKMGVVDRGSTLGFTIDGQAFGGRTGNPGPYYFTKKSSTLTIGAVTSPYQYRITPVFGP